MHVINLMYFIVLLVLEILILTNGIAIKKPFNYIAMLFLVPTIIILTPIVNYISREFILIFGVIYTVLGIALIFSYNYSIKKKR